MCGAAAGRGSGTGEPERLGVELVAELPSGSDDLEDTVHPGRVDPVEVDRVGVPPALMKWIRSVEEGRDCAVVEIGEVGQSGRSGSGSTSPTTMLPPWSSGPRGRVRWARQQLRGVRTQERYSRQRGLVPDRASDGGWTASVLRRAERPQGSWRMNGDAGLHNLARPKCQVHVPLDYRSRDLARVF